MEENIKESCDRLRANIQEYANAVRALHQHSTFAGAMDPDPDARSEMHANITLAFRHLEDARMRLGKVIQAYEERD